MGKNFVGDTSLSEKFSWVEANHENNEIKSTTKIFTYTVCKLCTSHTYVYMIKLATLYSVYIQFTMHASSYVCPCRERKDIVLCIFDERS